MHNNSKLNMFDLGLDASLIEAVKNIKENDAYNPSGSGPARLPAQPSAGGKMNIADDKKHGKGCTCNECSMTPGYDKTTRTYEEVETPELEEGAGSYHSLYKKPREYHHDTYKFDHPGDVKEKGSHWDHNSNHSDLPAKHRAAARQVSALKKKGDDAKKRKSPAEYHYHMLNHHEAAAKLHNKMKKAGTHADPHKYGTEHGHSRQREHHDYNYYNAKYYG